MNHCAGYLPGGTVYGVLLNSAAEHAHWSAHMAQPPYLAPPKAPVLYVKTANTWSPSGSAIALPADLPELEIGATIAMVIGASSGFGAARDGLARLAGYVLLNDLCVPHASYFRPPVQYRCRDGLLGIGANLVAPEQAGAAAALQLEVRVNGDLRQTVDFARMLRTAERLLADVGAFMTLGPGDLLMLGCDCLADCTRPRARAGDLIEISARGNAAFGCLGNTLVAQP